MQKHSVMVTANINKIRFKMITEKTKLGEIYKLKNSYEILSKYQVPCVTCPYAKLEMDKLDLGQIAEMYGINIKGLLEELNNKKNN